MNASLNTTATVARLLAWSNLRTALIWIYKGAPGQRSGVSPGRGFFAWQLEQGSVLVDDGSQACTARAGEWMIVPPGETSRTFSDDAQILSLHFQSMWPDERQLFNLNHPLVLPNLVGAKLTTVGHTLLEFVRKHFPDAYLHLPLEKADPLVFLQLQKHMMDWMIAFTRAMDQMKVATTAMAEIDERIVRARELIDLSSVSEPMQEQTLADQVGLSVSQLNRLFVAHFNTTPRRYSEQRRLAFAKRMLRASGMSIKQLAYNLGFKQPSHFSNWFRRQTSVSPREYRQAEVRPSQITV